MALPASNTITAGVNDTLQVAFDGVIASVTLAPGVNLTRSQLATRVQTAINSNSSILSAGLNASAWIGSNALNLATNLGVGKSINLTGGTALGMVSGVATATTTSGQNASGTINGAVAVASGQTLTGAADLSVDVSGASTGSHTINISQLPTQGSWLASGLSGSANILDDIDAALQQVNTEMVVQGATQNRMTSVIANLQTSNENLMEARSRIMDTDYAAETANLARHQIMQQAAMAMLAQANQSPKDVLALLR